MYRPKESVVHIEGKGHVSHLPPSLLGKLLMRSYAHLCFLLYHTGLFRALSWFKHHKGACAVLAYHGISSSPAPLCTTFKRFTQHLDFLERWGQPICINELADYLAANKPRKGLQYLITFDDPFANAIQRGVPELQRRNIQPVVFISSGLPNGEPPWWFCVPTILRKNSQAALAPIDPVQVKAQATLAYPDALLESLKASIPQEEFPKWISARMAENDIDHKEVEHCFPEGRIATWELLRAHRESYIAGSHTVHHTIIGRCSDRRYAEAEIANAGAEIERQLQTTCMDFAYPNGELIDHSNWSREQLERLGYRTAFTTEEGLVHADTDLLEIPRFYIGETPCWEIASKCVGFHATWVKGISRLRKIRRRNQSK